MFALLGQIMEVLSLAFAGQKFMQVQMFRSQRLVMMTLAFARHLADLAFLQPDTSAIMCADPAIVAVSGGGVTVSLWDVLGSLPPPLSLAWGS